ncbi:MAG: succinylglutamate desuccinylase/aspartoacylase family protein [Bdellovibrionota bacterium]
MKKNQLQQGPYLLAETMVNAGHTKSFEIPAFRLPTQTMISLPIHVIHGVRPGPTLGLCAAIHGNEINGIETIRRITQVIDPKKLSGTIIATPVVNVFGFINDSRYLPDRRDLNRSFPGSKRGSMASRLAFLFRTEVVDRCNYIIDYHTASVGKKNYPQIRCDLFDGDSKELAKVFNAPLILHSKKIAGSLRELAVENECNLLVYEGGEPSRFDEKAISLAVRGTFRVLSKLKMHPAVTESHKEDLKIKTLICNETSWIRAPRSGIFRANYKLGERVKDKCVLGTINDIFGNSLGNVRSHMNGIVAGIATNPSVHQGDALIHIGRIKEAS